MKLPIIATVICAVAVSACSRQATDTLPPLRTIEQATLSYANCVDIAARKRAPQPGELVKLATQAVDSCRNLRAKALSLKGVPVMFSTVDEYDATHFGIARQAIEKLRAKR